MNENNENNFNNKNDNNEIINDDEKSKSDITEEIKLEENNNECSERNQNLAKYIDIKLDDKLYEFLDKNNFNCVQTTIEVSPFERLKIKDEFKQFNDYRYKALYFRPSFKKSEYLKVIKYLNDIWGDLNEN